MFDFCYIVSLILQNNPRKWNSKDLLNLIVEDSLEKDGENLFNLIVEDSIEKDGEACYLNDVDNEVNSHNDVEGR
jgi:hypothetical protein